MLRMHRFAVAGFAFAFLAQAGCHSAPSPGDNTPVLSLTSASFTGDSIPAKFSCHGSDTSPALQWSAPPAATQSFALIVDDLDTPENFVHWVLYDLPAAARELPEAVTTQPQRADGSRQGVNDFGNTGYGGPCPPGSRAHRYRFRLYALDAKLGLPAGATRNQVAEAMQSHILAHGQIVARFQP